VRRPHSQRHPFFGPSRTASRNEVANVDFAGRRHQVLPEVVIRSAAWQVEDFGSGCAGLRKMPAGESGLEKRFGDLHRVERGAFEQLITRDPEAEPVVEGAIHAQSPDLTVVLLRSEQRQRILRLLRMIHQV
jgi:hypothetical protein